MEFHGSGELSHRDRRLQEAFEAAREQTGIHLADKIAEMEDHKGGLYVRWKHAPTEAEKEAVGELAMNVHHDMQG